MHDFKKLNVWQEAIELTIEAYQLTNKFPSKEVYGLSQQANRAAVSIPSNIAEGAGRNSTKEFNQFLGVATGSLYELETQLYIAKRLNYIGEAEFSQVEQRFGSVQRMLFNFQSYLKAKV